MASLKRELFRLAYKVHNLARELIFVAPDEISAVPFNVWKKEVSDLHTDVMYLSFKISKAPPVVKYHRITEEQAKGQPFYFFIWRAGGRIYRGSEFVRHPFVGLTLDEAIGLLENIVLTLDDYVDQKYIVKVGAVSVLIDEFRFVLTRNWNYRILVVSPTEWIKSWQIDKWGKEYSIKHRAIMFVQTIKLAPNYFVPIRWIPMTPEEIMLRMREGIHLQRWRSLMYDPQGLIVVRKIAETSSKIYWEVDFSAVKDKFYVSDVIPRDVFVDLIKNVIGRYHIQVYEKE